jgi:aspartate carbamoyltransferase catalytic subunit
MNIARNASTARQGNKPFLRHVVSINDLTNREIEQIFEVAHGYLKELSDKSFPHRIARGTTVGAKSILATLFYEPSTRTRLSFESAMLRLGGENVTSADPNTSSAAKGESLADSVRVISNYADIIVIRHPKDGAARLAADYSTVPVINGGDGSHEHPTQTLCDLFTLKTKKKNLRNLSVAIAGDLKGSRTVHSFVYALARFGAHIAPRPAPGMDLPAHVDKRLREEFRCTIDPNGPFGALYHTPDEPHQPTLFAEPEYKIVGGKPTIGAVYVTRFQKERWSDKEQAYPRVDAEFLKRPEFSHASVLHPLPRVGELDAAVDSDTRAIYFQQAAYGVPIRMALISLLLGLRKGKSLHQFEGGFDNKRVPIYDQPRDEGLQCANANCIVHDSSEKPYVRNKFQLVGAGFKPAPTSSPPTHKLRCAYCETDIEEFVIASKKNRWFTPDISSFLRINGQNFRDFIAFSCASNARAEGFHLRRHFAPQPELDASKASARGA